MVIIDLEVVGQLESSLLTRYKATTYPKKVFRAETTKEAHSDAKGLGNLQVSERAIEGLENGSIDATPIVLQVSTHTYLLSWLLLLFWT